MLVIPAIDLKGGKCVRLQQGRMDKDTVYSADPITTAERWVEAGARRLHVIDLDGARTGKPVNAEVIHRIAERFPDLPIQVGGGIRDEDTIQEYLDAGVSFVIIGTKAVTASHFVSDICMEFPSHIIVGLDIKDGRVAFEGWSKLSRHNAIELAQQMQEDGVAALIHTDVGRDGMLNGVNAEAAAEIARAVSVPVFAAGGVANLDDIRALARYRDDGIAGAVTGRAIYEGTLDLAQAQRLADELAGAAP
jgi:phosphoribosylformimino-5-aminoimidazole carboxamide ribotide isomerase